MASRPLESKFKIFKQNVDQHNKVYKNIDLAATFQVFPHLIDFEKLDPVRKQTAAYSQPHIIGEDGSMMRVFEDKARIREVSKPYIQWTLYTEDADVRAFFRKNYEPEGAKSGLGDTTFSVGLDSDNMGPEDLFVFEDFKDFPIRIVSDPAPDGMQYRYECQLWTSDIDFIELDKIGEGKRVIQIGSLIPEATTSRGNVTLKGGNAYIDFEIPMTRMGWSMRVTDEAWKAAKDFKLEAVDDAAKEALNDGLGSPDGILYSELDNKFIRATNRQIDMWLTYGRSGNRFASQYLNGLNQREVKAGPGLFEFLESAWQDEYPIKGGSLDLFRNFLKRIWLNKVETSKREVHVYTGSAGLEKIQKWCKAEDIDAVEQKPELHYGREAGFDERKNGVVIGKKQYVGFEIQPFGCVYFHYLPFLDSSAVETRTFEGYPISSYQFIIFDFGYGDVRGAEGQPNIEILKDSGYDNFFYGKGSWTPWGPVGQNQMRASQIPTTLNGENAYEIVREASMGFLVHDVSSMLWLQPAIS